MSFSMVASHSTGKVLKDVILVQVLLAMKLFKNMEQTK